MKKLTRWRQNREALWDAHHLTDFCGKYYKNTMVGLNFMYRMVYFSMEISIEVCIDIRSVYFIDFSAYNPPAV